MSTLLLEACCQSCDAWHDEDDPLCPACAATVTVRVLVTGSRTWPRPEVVWAALDYYHALFGDRMVVVHGDCRTGVDAMAKAWALSRGVLHERHPAEWGRYGRRAGQIRNRYMVAKGADLCLAFIHNGSPGASRCAEFAEQAGIRVHRWVI